MSVACAFLIAPPGAGAADGCVAPYPGGICGAISEDGSTVIFTSEERLSPDSLLEPSNTVYVRANGQTRLMARTQPGLGFTTPPGLMAVSRDARHAFVFTRDRLDPRDVDDREDIYELSDGSIRFLEMGVGAFGPGGPRVEFHGISDDGRHYVFSSSQPLLPSDVDSAVDIYEYVSGELRHVSTGPLDNEGSPPPPPGPIWPPPHSATFAGMSGDGRKIFFNSSRELVPGASGGGLYVRTDGAATEIVEDQHGETPGQLERVSSDGSLLLFATGKSYSSADTDGGYEDLYQRRPDGSMSFYFDQQQGDCRKSSDQQYQCELDIFDMSDDGTNVVIGTARALVPSDQDYDSSIVADHDFYLLAGGVPIMLSGGPTTLNAVRFHWPPEVSADGTRIAWHTLEPLLPEDQDSRLDVYLWDRGVVRLVTAGPSPGVEKDALLLMVSPAGDGVGFLTQEQMVPEDSDKALDYYLWRAGATSGAGGATTSAGKSRFRLISAESIPPQLEVGAPLRLSQRRGSLLLTCIEHKHSGPCRLRLRVRANGKLVARRYVRIKPLATRRLPLRLTRTGKKLLGDGALKKVTVYARTADRFGNRATVRVRRRVS